ncbi:aminotransferase family protein [Ilumatobacter nonamiensis]|uniref:aminotransferase family protein n=1 Tax=Ilumatobacter nonamiensis TaxID=467093 RepID=UPI00058C7AC0|nr:aminotransferase class III-fold pyridoxal phosphate-dependent enzyme [Ilumatobacter nonamiensis]
MAAHPFLHPFASPTQPESDFVDIVGGSGAIVTDANGNDYIDALGSLWYCQIGHGRVEMRDAIVAQLDRIAGYNVFDPFTNGPAARLAEMIADVAPMPDGRVFLASSGSEAIDTVLKLARLTHQRRGDHDRQIIVRRTGGYHGTNFGGTSAQGIAPNREGWGDLVPHFIEVPSDDVEALATVFAEHGPRIAAFLTEPVQGAGGVLMPPDGYLASARRLCDQHGALLILDEVICGFGRTGNWFGAQTFDVAPDLITFAKGVTSGYLPLSGVVAARSVCDTLESSDEMLRTGYTYSGHPTCAAAAIRNIELIRDEGLCARAEHIGNEFVAGFEAMQSDGVIGSFRGVGAIWAIDVGHDALSLRSRLLDRGVVVRGIGTAIALCPPLVITDEQIASVIDTITDVLASR